MAAVNTLLQIRKTTVSTKDLIRWLSNFDDSCEVIIAPHGIIVTSTCQTTQRWFMRIPDGTEGIRREGN